MTLCPDLPIPGMCTSEMFYFNVKGSMNKKDVKLVAVLSGITDPCDGNSNQCVCFNNDTHTQTWQSMKQDYPSFFLPTKYYLFQISADFWVAVFCF